METTNIMNILTSLHMIIYRKHRIKLNIQSDVICSIICKDGNNYVKNICELLVCGLVLYVAGSYGFCAHQYCCFYSTSFG